jgi:glucose-6-phosphate 1-epimerase
MNPATLRQRFPLPGLSFDEHNGLPRVHVTTPQASATIYLQGAHLTAWQPAGFNPAILLSSKSLFAPGKPIRGGIPVVFPWFAGDKKKDRLHDETGPHPGPSHGFARVEEWSLDHAAAVGASTQLTFSLGPTALSRSMGFDAFLLTLVFTIGAELSLTLTVTNTGAQPLQFEEAFHTYFRVADIHETVVAGLESISFLDKTAAGIRKPAQHAPIRFTQTLDRVYNGTTSTCEISDPAGRRVTRVAKEGSNSTVVWNSFAELAEIGPWDWHEYVAVETANVGDDALTLAPKASATMRLHVTQQHM